MKPKKEKIERAINNGSFDRVNRLLSAAHVMVCVANGYAEEAQDLLKSNELSLGELKKAFNSYQKAADVYFKEFASMVTNEKMTMFSDMEEVDQIFRDWAKLEKDWKPKEL